MEGHRHWLLRDEAQSKVEHIVFKWIEGQVQAKASGRGKLDFVVVQRTVREDILLNGCLHRALQREAVNSTETFSCSSTTGEAAKSDTNTQILLYGKRVHPLRTVWFRFLL